MFRKEVYRSASRGRVGLAQDKAWSQSFTVPEKGHTMTNVRCPVCHAVFQMKVHSKAKARMRKFYFAASFFAVAAVALGLGVYAGKRKGFMVLSLSAPFIIFSLWQLRNALGGRFDPSDLITHAGGKVHRIFDDHKITLS